MNDSAWRGGGCRRPFSARRAAAQTKRWARDVTRGQSSATLPALMLVAVLLFGFTASMDAQAQRPFITTWQTNFDNHITIPTNVSGYNYYVRGSEVGNPSNSGNGGPYTGDATISFPSPGTYEVQITGDFPRIYLRDNVDAGNSIRTIEQWGDISWSSMDGAFSHADNLTFNAQDDPDVSNVESMIGTFVNAYSFNGDLGGGT